MIQLCTHTNISLLVAISFQLRYKRRRLFFFVTLCLLACSWRVVLVVRSSTLLRITFLGSASSASKTATFETSHDVIRAPEKMCVMWRMSFVRMQDASSGIALRRVSRALDHFQGYSA